MLFPSTKLGHRESKNKGKKKKEKVDASMQCKYASPHIAVYVLLAGGQPLVAAPLFAVNASGGLNCTKVL